MIPSLIKRKRWFVVAVFVFSQIAINCGGSKEQPHVEQSIVKEEVKLFEEDGYAPVTYSQKTISNLAGVQAALPLKPPTTTLSSYEIDPTLIETASRNPVLMAEFPLIPSEKLASIFNKMLNFQNGTPGISPASMPELSLCGCGQAPLEERLLTVLKQAERLLEKVPAAKRSQKIVHTAFGEDSYFQTYLLAMVLSEVGFRDVNIYGIGPYVVPWEKNESKYKEYFQALPGIHAPQHFKTAYEYLEAIRNKKAYPSHSFDAVDVGPYHEAADVAKVRDLFKFSNFHIRGTAVGRSGYRHYFTVSVNKSNLSQSSCVGNYTEIYGGFDAGNAGNERNEFLTGVKIADAEKINYAQPYINNFCQGFLARVSGASASEDFQAVVAQYSQDWLGKTPAALALYHKRGIIEYPGTAWDEFAGLVDLARAPQTNPVIFVLQSNVIPGPIEHNAYFPSLGGKNVGVDLWTPYY